MLRIGAPVSSPGPKAIEMPRGTPAAMYSCAARRVRSRVTRAVARRVPAYAVVNAQLPAPS